MGRTAKIDKNDGFAEPNDSCCSRFLEDITGTFACRPSFRAVDGSRNIDVPASFSPKGWTVIMGKAVTLGVAAFTLYLGLGLDLRAFWLAYLTNWNVTISSVYLLLSFSNTFITVPSPPVGQTRVNGRVKATWILFTIFANIGLLVTVAYWTLIFDGLVEMATVFPHGILTLAVLVDGFGFNAIPIRLRHYLEVVVPLAMAYLIWSYLHSVLGLGNPDYMDEDPETNDDLIYQVLDWKTDAKATAGYAIVLVFILSPLLQILLWMISGCRRRYETESRSDTTSSSYVEMGNAGAAV